MGHSQLTMYTVLLLLLSLVPPCCTTVHAADPDDRDSADVRQYEWGYYPPLHEMSITEIDGEAAGRLDHSTRLFARLEAATDMRIEQAVRLGSASMLTLTGHYRLPVDEQRRYLADPGQIYQLSNARARSRQLSAADGSLDDAELYLCIGDQWPSPYADAIEIEMFDCGLSFPRIANAIVQDGRPLLLSRRGISEWHWMAVCVADLDFNGQLDIAIPWTAGVSGGGGFDIFALDEKARLLPADSFSSAYAAFSLVDLDRDGSWEIEGRDRLSYEGAAGSFEYNVIWAFDHGTDSWRPDTDRFDAYFQRQREFYSSLRSAKLDFEMMGFATYRDELPCMPHDGKYYRLTNISGEDFESVPSMGVIASLDELLSSWDSSPYTRIWDHAETAEEDVYYVQDITGEQP